MRANTLQEKQAMLSKALQKADLKLKAAFALHNRQLIENRKRSFYIIRKQLDQLLEEIDSSQIGWRK